MNREHLKTILDLVNEIELNLSREYSLENIVTTTKISQWHFQRLFKAFTGDTFGGYLKGRRLAKAAVLLVETELTITQIAFETGHQSHSSFSRLFKAYYDYSPTKFRKMKPSLILKTKPLLTKDLINHIQNQIQIKPDVKIIPKQFIIGMETTYTSPYFINYRGYDKVLVPFWKEFLIKRHEIRNKVPNKYLGISKSPSGKYNEKTITYLAGVEVKKITKIPEGMKLITIPEQKVAIFDISGRCNLIQENINYIYGIWMKNASYKRGDGDDYEVFDNTYDYRASSSMSKYVIPIK